MPRVRVPTDASADELVRLLRAAALRIRRRIRADLDAGRPGTAAHRTRQLSAIRVELERLRPRAQNLAQVAAGRAWAAGALGAGAAPDAPSNIAFSGIHLDALQALADEMSGRVDGAIMRLGRSARDVYRDGGLLETALGVAGGDARATTSRALRDRLERQGVTAFVDRAGRRWSMETYTAMVVRTNTRQAMTSGTVARMVELGQDLIAISDHDTETPLCKHFEGKTFSLTGRTPGYPILRAFPPFHPNCEHVAQPAGANLDAFERLLGLAAA